MVKIWGKYEATVDLDWEGMVRCFPQEFFADDLDGELIASDATIKDWIDGPGRQIIQEYFVTDIISITDEINYEFIEVNVDG